VYSKLFMLEIKSDTTQTISIGNELFGEAGLYILEGSIENDGSTFGPKQILVAKDTKLCQFTIHAGSTVYIFGGEPFPEERYIFWNFVATSTALIEKAKQQWVEQSFPVIPGEHGFIPLPEVKAHLKEK